MGEHPGHVDQHPGLDARVGDAAGELLGAGKLTCPGERSSHVGQYPDPGVRFGDPAGEPLGVGG
ncbi:hypothetical protein [Frankia nepalensis]|uniref:Uncharacterized protein n=1 Tax=Frankia nepalensis TaxID=1836974 RepID=A0A937RKP5_9ACTN|nr:hypothetical protein [Frankia nepalensis]MBL7499040.1 hypothetical protein [Frankia nepalensis]MBL7515637.1 hypothetical protein [Frankia nepalensis]MBL7632052.1 hypothetical protein [Frankia nepalensis]